METFNIWLVAGVLVGLVGTLIFTRLKPLYAFAGALLILYFSGLLPKEQLLLNFVNESVISLLLLLLTSLALEKTRFVQQMANLLLKGKERFVLFKMMTSAGLLSSVTNTPYGYQTNLMVYSPGKYRYLDYVRAGLPLSIVYGIAVCALVPWFFPF